MKISLRWLSLCVTLLACVLSNRAQAQEFGSGAFQPVMAAELPSLIPGRFWFEANVADEGLGYSGSYVTLGGKTHIFQDFLDGRWLLEAQGHVSTDSGGLFANIGIERVFSIPAAGADVSGGFWFDYDDDQQGGFAHTMTAVGASAKIKTQRWELYANGYFPIGTTDFAQGDPAGIDCFLNHSIVLTPGIDSALRGVDAMFRLKPAALAQVNGSIEVGGYAYTSDLVESFGGVRVRGGLQVMRGLLVTGEVNNDDRFGTTGVLSLSMIYGGSARGTEYGFLARDLDPTIRNDHVVRYQQDLVLAIDPDTGAPYNVFHVDNTADAAFANGTVETPFTTLSDAEMASVPDSIIFVREGDGTTRGLDQGIALQDGQLLLGDGVQHLIPIQNGQSFVLCNDIDGNLPTITNTTGGPAVTLASRNTVRGFIIDNTVPGGFISNGIEASSGSTQNFGVIEDVTIVGPVLNGISLNDISGDWRFARNNISGAGIDGIFIDNAGDPNSVFEFVNNVVTGNGRDGIHIEDYDGSEFNFSQNTITGNFRDGIRMERFLGTNGDFNFVAPNIQDNLGNGLSIIGANGDFSLVNATIMNNSASGVNLVDFTNGSGERTFIGTTPGGVSNISGNGVGAGANVRIVQNVGNQDVLITNTTLDNGGMGVFGLASGLGANLDFTLIDNISIDNSITDGIRFISEDGGTMTFLVENTMAPLSITGSGGNGIAVFAGSASAGLISSQNGTIRNVAIAASGQNGILANVDEDGQLGLDIADSTIALSGLDGMNINIDSSPNLAVNFVRADNLTITGSGDDAIDINTFDDSLFDFVLTNSTLTNLNAGGTGIEVFAQGGMGGVVDDNRTRLLIQNNAISGFDGDGISVFADEDARILATIDGNTITNNGEGADNTMLPFFNGIAITSTDESVISAMVTNNSISGNFEQGVAFNSLGTSVLNAILIGNNIAGNDIGEDAPMPPITANNADMVANNGPLATTCLAMSNNFFALPAIVTNAGGAVSFQLELDGITNGLGVPAVFGAVTNGPFSALCIPNFNTEADAFEADGFPPQ